MVGQQPVLFTEPATDLVLGRWYPDLVALEVSDVADVERALGDHGYLADEGLAVAVFLALRLQRPLLLEGDAGVGKTEVAKTLARWTGRDLIRVQCAEGLDAAQTVYEWDHARQLLHLRAAEAAGEASGKGTEALEDELYDERFLVRRPLLQAIAPTHGAGPSVLLIDELDRADDEFEAFLLELLAEWSITVPELGTFRAGEPPIVVITSNRTRELHDALKRRCIYHWVGYPSPEREVEIVLVRAPGASEALTRKVVAAVHRLRRLELAKPPGVAETIDWVRTLEVIGAGDLDAATVDDTLGAVVKERDDLELVRANLDGIAAGG